MRIISGKRNGGKGESGDEYKEEGWESTVVRGGSRGQGKGRGDSNNRVSGGDGKGEEGSQLVMGRKKGWVSTGEGKESAVGVLEGGEKKNNDSLDGGS